MFGISRITEVLPHRHPILLVDRVVELRPGQGLTAVKAVTAAEPWYADVPAGGDPADYAYPQVLVVESWCQAAGVLVAAERPVPDVVTGRVMLFGGMADIVFHGEVYPGDVMEHRVRLVRALSDTVVFEGEVAVGSAVVAEIGRVVMAMRPAAELAGAVPEPTGT